MPFLLWACVNTHLPQRGSPGPECPSWSPAGGCKAPRVCRLCRAQCSHAMSPSLLKEKTYSWNKRCWDPFVFCVLQKQDWTLYLIWAPAACPRTGSSSVLPPPWFWRGLGLQRTVRWPFGSPVVYQLAVNSPVCTRIYKLELLQIYADFLHIWLAQVSPIIRQRLTKLTRPFVP